MADILDKAAEGLRVLFRHMLPGILIFMAAGASHPAWFLAWFKENEFLNVSQTGHLIVLAAVALVVGNTWYVCHRYTIHQLLDYGMTAVGKRRWTPSAYSAWLAEHIDKSCRFPDYAKGVHDHIAFKASQVLYLYIVAEVSVAFTISPQTGSLFDSYSFVLRPLGVALFLFAVIQQWLLWRVDVHAVEQHGGKAGASDTSPV